MSRICLCVATAGIALLAGCAGQQGQRLPLNPVIHEGLPLRKPGIAISMPAPEGLEGFDLEQIEGLYRVNKTDTLISIAERFYGDRAYSARIYQRNKAEIDAARGLKRGMVLTLPKRPMRKVSPGLAPVAQRTE